MANNWLERVVIKNVVPLNKDLGRGSYGKVFAVKYCGSRCAAKEIHSILLETQDDARESIIRSFLRECYHCSELRHPNIVQFMGVYFGGSDGNSNLPVMVMEMMDQSLTSLVEKRNGIEIKVKMSILHDVSLGLNYLHGQDEPIVHRDLSPNNVLLTTHMVAKISDLGIARVLKSHNDSRKPKSKLTKVPGTLHFMPPETFNDNPTYDTSIDVFSYAGITLHLICEEWPTPTNATKFDAKTGRLMAFTEVERRQKYFDKISGKLSAALKPLLKSCLDNDPSRRPPITAVSEQIELLKEMKEDETISSQSGGTKKVKPPVQPRRAFKSLSSSSANDHQHSRNLSRSKSPSNFHTDLTTSLPSDFDPQSYREYHSDTQYVNTDFRSLPSNCGTNGYRGYDDSNSPHENVDFTSSLPSNVSTRSYVRSQSDSPRVNGNHTTSSPTSLPAELNASQKPPIPKPRTQSLNTYDVTADVCNTKTSNHDTYPAKVNDHKIQQLVRQYKAVTAGLTKESKPQKVPLMPALQSGQHQIKWRRCANLTYPMYGASIATDKECVYVMGDCPERKALNVVFVYTIVADSWSQLPPSDHCWAVLQIVGDKLTIFGGIDNYTNERTNRVSTFDQATRDWRHFYPDMIDVRFRPGVTTHMDYVIVAGGNKDSINVRNNIEVLNWRQCKRWIKSSVCLPVPMWAFTPIISNDELYIAGYSGEDNRPHRKVYKIHVVYVTSSVGQDHQGANQWVNLPPSSYYYNSLIPNSSPPMFLGGEDGQGIQSSNISMYDSFSNSWRYVDSLTSPRAGVAVATIDDYSIIVVGGYTKGHGSTAAKLSSLPLVEIGQAELA